MGEEGSVPFLQETNYSYKFRKDLQVNSKAFECLCVKTDNKNSKNIMPSLVYRPANGDHKELESYFISSLLKREISRKDMISSGYFNINLLDFDANKKVFVNLMFRFGMIPKVNKPTRVTRQTASAIDHITANSIRHTGFKSRIIKTDISYHFPIFICFKYIARKEDAKKAFIYKRRLSDQSIGTFTLRLHDINWSKGRKCPNGNEAYTDFFNIIDSLYEECFPVAKIRLK